MATRPMTTADKEPVDGDCIKVGKGAYRVSYQWGCEMVATRNLATGRYRDVSYSAPPREYVSRADGGEAMVEEDGE